MSRRGRCAATLALAMTLGALGTQGLAPGAASAAPAPAQAAGATADRYVVTLRPSAAPAQKAHDKARAYGLQLRHVYTSALHGFAATVPAGRLQALQRDPDVESVVPDLLVRVAAAPVDQRGVGIRRTWADRNATTLMETGDSPVQVGVAVLDTGIAPHEELNVAGGTSCVPGATSHADAHGHGTHVAGIIGARDNGVGVVGVAPGVKLYSVRVLGATGEGSTSDIICGINWVTQHAASLGIRVANMSLGGAAPAAGTADPMRSAVANSVSGGTAYAVAAGNSNADTAGVVPASYPEVTTVSAISDTDGVPGGKGISNITGGADDTLASFSNWGAPVDLAAPGVNINSTHLNGTYKLMSGTSMASPFVAGAMAIYRYKNPTATPAATQAGLQAVGWAQGTANGFTRDRDAFPERLLDVGDVGGAALPARPHCYPSLTSGAVATSVKLTCTDLGAGETAEVFWDSTAGTRRASFTTTSTGSGSVSFGIPDTTGGAHSIVVKGATSQLQTTLPFTVIPTAKLSVITGKVGAALTVAVKGYAAGEPLQVAWDATTLASATTSPLGSASIAVKVPEAVRGAHAVSVTGTTTPTARLPYTVVPSIVLAPASGKVGAATTATLRGFSGGEQVAVNWYGTATTSTLLGTITSTALGSGSLPFTVPAATRGAHKVEAVGPAGAGTSTTYAVASSLVLSRPGTVTPVTSGHVGDALTVTLTGYTASETVDVQWFDTPTTPRTLTTVTASSAGSATATITVPATFRGSYRVSGTGSAGSTSSVTFTVAARLVLSPAQGPAGTQVTATATAVRPGETVTLRWFSTATASTVLSTGVADSGGTYRSTFAVPEGTAGAFRVEATGSTSLTKVATTFTRG